MSLSSLTEAALARKFKHPQGLNCHYTFRIGALKGKSAIAVARLCGREQNFTGEHLWARGYAVSTVGFNLDQIRQYIRAQEEADGAEGRF